jgi:hypothetical protein
MSRFNSPPEFTLRMVVDKDNDVIKFQQYVSFRENFKDFKMWRDIPIVTLEESVNNIELVDTDGGDFVQ